MYHNFFHHESSHLVHISHYFVVLKNSSLGDFFGVLIYNQPFAFLSLSGVTTYLEFNSPRNLA